MSKKLRESGYVNDLVVYRNACEEKKLKFTLSQIQNLKEIYSRQKEQEKMFFAVQHMPVPVKTGAGITNLRRQLNLDWKRRTQSAPVPGLIPEVPDLSRSKSTMIPNILGSSGLKSSTDEKLIEPNELSEALLPDNGERDDIRIHSPLNERPSTVLASATNSSDILRDKLKSSRRLISPRPRKGNYLNGPKIIPPTPNKFQMLDAGKETPSLPSRVTISPFADVEEPSNVKTSRNPSAILDVKTKDSVQPRMRTPSLRFINTGWVDNNEKSSSWRKKESDARTMIANLPPVRINIYEPIVDEKESKKKWQTAVDKIRNSSIVEKLSDAEIYQRNREIRQNWQSSYATMKKDRIMSMMKDNLTMNEGEQLTFVKFLPKSKQSRFIKEVRLTQHKL